MVFHSIIGQGSCVCVSTLRLACVGEVSFGGGRPRGDPNKAGSRRGIICFEVMWYIGLNKGRLHGYTCDGLCLVFRVFLTARGVAGCDGWLLPPRHRPYSVGLQAADSQGDTGATPVGHELGPWGIKDALPIITDHLGHPYSQQTAGVWV